MQRSNSNIEGVAPGDGDDRLEFVGLSESHLGSGEADQIYPLVGATPLASPRPLALSRTQPQHQVGAISVTLGSPTDLWDLVIGISAEEVY